MLKADWMLRALSVALAALAGTALVYRATLEVSPSSAETAQVRPPSIEPKPIDPGPPPADAIILFDGKDLSKWRSFRDGGEARWQVRDGVMTVVAGSGDIATRQQFGDAQLHIEWATPTEIKGEGQGRGNSGVFLQERYEVQVLDSYQNKTYFHGQAAAIYKQHAPLVNASRRPGEWQTYDIIFRAPRFDESGRVQKKAIVTVLHNGVLVQDHAEILGSTTNLDVPLTYTKHGDGSLRLQDHGNPMRFRNIWIRPL
jgi:hypothetical protein